jgi:hypothetical protein
VVFLGLPGLVGTGCSVLPLLIGMYFAGCVLDWSDSRQEIY